MIQISGHSLSCCVTVTSRCGPAPGQPRVRSCEKERERDDMRGTGAPGSSAGVARSAAAKPLGAWHA